MTQPAYSRLPRARRVADIMAAARAVFDEKGYAAASVAEIAERAGVVEGSVYRYFEHKRALLIAVVERWYGELLSDFDEHLKVITGTWNRLRYLVWKHLSAIEKQPMLVRLVFEELRSGPDYRRTAVFQVNRRYTRCTIDVLKEGIAHGEIRRDIPLGIARDMIFGGVEHHTWAFVRGEGAFSPVAAADAIVDILRRGIAVPEARHVPKGPRRKPR
jgi:TetR/AcrR family fatty acid metabolism transcriptional regulator